VGVGSVNLITGNLSVSQSDTTAGAGVSRTANSRLNGVVDPMFGPGWISGVSAPGEETYTGLTITGLLDSEGEFLQDFKKIATPRPATPEQVLDAMITLTKQFTNYNRIAVGFPGYVKRGIVFTAPNLSTDAWKGVNINGLVAEALGKPVRVVNDADLQGLAVVSGAGLEMVITLGTGFGTALLLDGNLLPHLELAHQAVTKKHTYDTYVGNSTLKKIGITKWNKRVQKILEMIKTVFNYDRLYISGGNAGKLNFDLDPNIEVVRNKDGIKGGARVWQLDDNLFMKSRKL
jgi:polyphosphate glucokinase